MTLSRFEIVVLAALARPKPPSISELARDVQKLALPDQATGAVRDQVTATLARSSELVEAARRVLTDSGRAALQHAFGVSRPPTWREVKTHHAPALALGLRPTSPEAQHALASSTALQAAVIAHHHGLPPAPDIRALCQHLLFEKLQLRTFAVKDKRLLMHVLAARAGMSDPKGDLEKVAARLAAVAVGARNGSKATLVEALARRWATQRDDARPASFGDAVRAALERVPPSGRYGQEKVFIASLWDAIAAEAKPAGMDLAQFKRWLIDANASQDVVLARADLVGAMDPAQVAASEIVDRGASFHFVLAER